MGCELPCPLGPPKPPLRTLKPSPGPKVGAAPTRHPQEPLPSPVCSQECHQGHWGQGGREEVSWGTWERLLPAGVLQGASGCPGVLGPSAVPSAWHIRACYAHPVEQHFPFPLDSSTLGKRGTETPAGRAHGMALHGTAWLWHGTSATRAGHAPACACQDVAGSGHHE